MMPLRILICGTGLMAGHHARAFGAMRGVEIAAAVDIEAERLSAFAETHGIERQFTSLEEAIAWGGFDASSNATPDPVHHATTLPLLAAGKHVLCEKPLATTPADADEMALKADAAGIVHMVNLTYRNVPALNAARTLVADGHLGDLRHFDAAYLQSWLTQPAWGDWRTTNAWLWRLSTSHGSAGVLGDVGVHILDFLTFAAGEDITELSCQLTTFDKAPGNRIGDYDLDANDTATMQARLSGGAAGVIHASRFATGHLNDLMLSLHGTKGALQIKYRNGVDELHTCIGPDAMEAALWTVEAPPDVPTNFERFVAAVRRGTGIDPDFHRGAALQHLLDLAQRSDSEKGRRLTL